MLIIPAGYVKNDFNVYGRDSSILLSRRGRGRSYLHSLYDFARQRKKEVRVESKGPRVFIGSNTSSPTLC